MKDATGRNIEYLRLSLTERCNLKCAYCRAAEGECPKDKELTAEDFLRIVRCMASLGFKKVRLTGGEPTVRKDLVEIVRGIAATEGITEIAMTTNAQLLEKLAQPLKEAGLTRVNVSIDSLKAERYREITGGGELENVLRGVDAAIAAGLVPIKLNAVLMRGKNDDEIDDLIALAKDRPIDMRFIELMPMGKEDHTSERIPTDEIVAARPYLIPLAPRYAGQPSSDYKIEGYVGRVGFISPISHKFCGDCNRVRVMSDGMLRPCLGVNREVSLKETLEISDSALLKTIREAIWNKPEHHEFSEEFKPAKDMSRIGG